MCEYCDGPKSLEAEFNRPDYYERGLGKFLTDELAKRGLTRDDAGRLSWDELKARMAQKPQDPANVAPS